MSKTFVVAAYDQAMAYGGPQEGGWWYDRGCLVRVLKTFKNEDKAYNYTRRINRTLSDRKFGPNQGKREYSSVLSDGLILAHCYEDTAPKGFPDRRPHYE